MSTPTGPPEAFERILVTGAHGFVGRRLVDRLRGGLGAGARVFSPPRTLIDAEGAAGPVMDLEDPVSVWTMVGETKPDLIIHLAGQSSVSAGSGPQGAGVTWRSNALGALHLAEAVASLAPSATVLFSSSVEIYGQAFRDGPVDEDTLPQPMNAYAHSKLAAERILGDLLPPSAKLITVRPGNHSGAGQDPRFVLPAFASQIRQPEIRVGNLDAQRDFLHVDDVIDAYMAIIGRAGDLAGREVFNIASGRPVAVGVLLNRLMQIAGSTADVQVDPARLRPNDIPRTVISANRLTEATGWRPRRSIDEMLIDILADVRPDA